MADTSLKPLKDLDAAIPRTRLNIGLNGLFSIVYLPVGALMATFRVFVMLQAILILVVVAEGILKRTMLRIIFAVLGIVVTTSGFEGQDRKVKVLAGNKVSFIDHIVLHLALDCRTHDDGDQLVRESQERPMFDEEGGGAILYAVQPEIHPTDGRSALLPFSTMWPFVVEESIQLFVLSAYRPFGPALTVAASNGWWDLLWTLLTPFTFFHLRMLPVLHKKSEETVEDFCSRAQHELAKAIGLSTVNFTPGDFKQWLSGPPPPPRSPSPKPTTALPQGPIITASEFASLPQSQPAGIEAMVQQVTAVLPHVPHSAIRRDLLVTRSVDVTIANILEGQVTFVPQGTPMTSSLGAPSRPSPSRSSIQRHTSLEERKRTLIAEARRRYLEKHKNQFTSPNDKRLSTE